ncbi:hypothetical protein V0M98_33415 (plasmid) [Pseudomonas silesiensis]|mgnify:FL=1|uniref:hypothetical protein n=1 Tax=Pseudomonas silesiensis TaxID=1853130 RepID=UPI0030D1AEF5
MPETPEITREMWWKMCDVHLSRPIPLYEADLSRPFIYERAWGVSYVPCGFHQGAMTLLLAFQHDLKCGIDVANKLNLEFSSGTADHWLEHSPGAAFLSSVGKTIQVGNPKGLTIMERRKFRSFGEIACPFE